MINPIAFDAFAASYDDDFTHSILGRLLRPRVWEKLAQHFTAGQHILELACGTGEDALWLARRGVHVTATDGSGKMIRVARAKADEMVRRGDGETGRRGEDAERRGDVEFKQVSLQEIARGYFDQNNGIEALAKNSATGSAKAPTPVKKVPGLRSPVPGRFDGVFSNFGGLNTLSEWRSLAEALAGVVKLGGKMILVPMGPVCPWEIFWHAGHGQFGTAFRRWSRDGAPAKIGDSMVPIRYPSARRLQTDFAPWFTHLGTESLGLWLPPSYLDSFVNRRAEFFARLNRFEKITARLTGGWGDHYVIVFERR